MSGTVRPRPRRVPALLLAGLLACGSAEESASSGASDARLAEARATLTTVPKGPCPATGHWSVCTIIERLDRAGVAPRVDSAMVEEDGLRQRGRRVRVGRAELLLFLYPDSAARVADEARLDARLYVDPSQSPTMRNEATLIRSDNLLAILRSRNETQRERIALAITAGPPQARP